MNKTAKIISIYDPDPNYGNRLQNYAAQTILERMGLKVTTVSFQKQIYEDREWFTKYIMYRLTGFRLSNNPISWRCTSAKIWAFDRFNRRYIHTKRIKRIDQIGDADYFVVGSDQVWNPTWYYTCELKKDIYLLTFAKPEQKVCLSPSFGMDKLPDEWIPWFEKHLAAFPRFSVREEAGARLIKELTGKDAAVTVDPTLMLDKEDWMRIAKAPKGVDCSKKYILTYFIGGRSAELDREIAGYAKELGNAAVYNLLDLSQPELYVSAPSEFVYLIANAELVMTDSFHSCVFSFLFGKPFLCYDRLGPRNNMNSRMETFFGKFDLRRKYVNSGLTNELSECDYGAGYAALQPERDKLMDFLKSSMDKNVELESDM